MVAVSFLQVAKLKLREVGCHVQDPMARRNLHPPFCPYYKTLLITFLISLPALKALEMLTVHQERRTAVI